MSAIRQAEPVLSATEASQAGLDRERLLRLYRDKELRVRLSVKAKEEYAPIEWEVMKKRYLEMMARIAGVGQSRPIEPEAQVSRATHG